MLKVKYSCAQLGWDFVMSIMNHWQQMLTCKGISWSLRFINHRHFGIVVDAHVQMGIVLIDKLYHMQVCSSSV